MLEQLTACECTDAGWCERHQCQKDTTSLERCQRFQGWFELWESGRGPGQNLSRSMMDRLRSVCLHRGPHVRFEKCPSCIGNVEIKIFQCSIHGECNLSGTMLSTACCLSCGDFQSTLVPVSTRG
jgi:hypothetical protein